MVLIAYNRTLAALGNEAEARKVLERILELTPCSVSTRIELAESLGAQSEHAAQVETLQEGRDECPESYELLNNLAYALATVPRDELRDGAAAVRAAQRAAVLTGQSNASVLDTLAAAHAEAGDFESAVAVSERAVRMVQQQGYSREARELFEQSLERYRAGQPMRAP
jgi:tetratricopeptide (TPR) repeat protein